LYRKEYSFRYDWRYLSYGMVDTRNTALEERPESFYCVGMRIAHDVDFGGMIYALVLISHLLDAVVALKFIAVYGGTGCQGIIT